ncbi:MAG TPA: hypothetical protein VEL03_21260 [Streptosporangiaceae bacterium]|nr:hypothetical protein [Streptosporangiaceae bacterium]
MASTGGASAATGSDTGTSASSTTMASATAARPCVQIANELRATGHPVAARRVRAICRARALGFILARGIHGEVTYKAKSGFATVAFERGTVESASPSAVTVQAADGTTWTWDIVGNTVVRESGHKVAEDTLAQGDTVLVVGKIVDGAYDARLIRIRATSTSTSSS